MPVHGIFVVFQFPAAGILFRKFYRGYPCAQEIGIKTDNKFSFIECIGRKCLYSKSALIGLKYTAARGGIISDMERGGIGLLKFKNNIFGGWD